MYTQVIGKLRLAWSAPQNQFWHVPFYLTVRGLTTSPMPSAIAPSRSSSTSSISARRPAPATVARARYAGSARRLRVLDAVCALLRELDVEVRIWDHPVEIPIRSRSRPTPATAATTPTPRAASRGPAPRRDRLQAVPQHLLRQSRARDFFWGSFDLAVTRFSGRAAPRGAGAESKSSPQLSYNEEVISVGFGPDRRRSTPPSTPTPRPSRLASPTCASRRRPRTITRATRS